MSPINLIQENVETITRGGCRKMKGGGGVKSSKPGAYIWAPGKKNWTFWLHTLFLLHHNAFWLIHTLELAVILLFRLLKHWSGTKTTLWACNFNWLKPHPLHWLAYLSSLALSSSQRGGARAPIALPLYPPLITMFCCALHNFLR